jgi:plastocyanin
VKARVSSLLIAALAPVAIAFLPSCDRTATGESARTSSSQQAPAVTASPRPADSAARGGTSFDEALFAKVAPSTIAGQVLDRNGKAQKDIVVYIHEGLRGTKYPVPAPVTIDQRDKAFQPRVLAVLAGTKISFKNADMVLHNVYSRSLVKAFDLGTYPQGQSKDATFDQPGRVDVFCAIHTNMHAIVLVLDNPYFATSDGRGYFEIPNVPAGSYGLRVWSERDQEQEIRSEVVADQGTIMRVKLP